MNMPEFTVTCHIRVQGKRPGLQKMLADAQKGKIDLILTKSVSRFARNTSIVLEATRKLKELNVGVFLNFRISIPVRGRRADAYDPAAFAQAESESGSVGAKMVYQRSTRQVFRYSTLSVLLDIRKTKGESISQMNPKRCGSEKYMKWQQTVIPRQPLKDI